VRRHAMSRQIGRNYPTSRDTW